ESDIASGVRFFAWMAVGISLFSLACAVVLSIRLRRIGLAGAAANNIVGTAMLLALGALPLAYVLIAPAMAALLTVVTSPLTEFVWSVSVIFGAAVGTACPYVWLARRESRRLPPG